MKMRDTYCLLVLASILLWGASPARATVIVHTLLSETSVAPGESFTIELRADLSDPVLGFGLDLPLPGVVPLALPSVGPDWTALPAPDGDGLAGQAFPVGISGNGVLLVTLSVLATTPGTWVYTPSATPGDLTEGFPLDPIGFDTDVTWLPGQILVVPEPGTLCLVAGPLVGLAFARRRRGAGDR